VLFDASATALGYKAPALVMHGCIHLIQPSQSYFYSPSSKKRLVDRLLLVGRAIKRTTFWGIWLCQIGKLAALTARAPNPNRPAILSSSPLSLAVVGRSCHPLASCVRALIFTDRPPRSAATHAIDRTMITPCTSQTELDSARSKSRYIRRCPGKRVDRKNRIRNRKDSTRS